MLLFTGIYEDADSTRTAELVFCLRKNILNPCFSKIFLFLESQINADQQLLRAHSKIGLLGINRRALYADYFEEGNKFPGEIIVIANSDIFFDDTLKLVETLDMTNRLLCLTRWEYRSDTEFGLQTGAHSQDVWIYKAPIAKIDCPFGMGRWACDNKLAYRAQEAGVLLANPCLDIRSYHYHISGVKHYQMVDDILGQGRTVKQVHLADVPLER